MGKRQLGIGKVKKSKKVKTEEERSEERGEETEGKLTIELESTSDDEFVQLKSLYDKYGESKNELILNGIIHECDRLIRNNEAIPSFFYHIYASSLLELIHYKTSEEFSDLIDLSLEKIDLGLEKHASDTQLNLTKARILANKLVIQLGNLKQDETLEFDFKGAYGEIFKHYEIGEAEADTSLFSEQTFEVLKLVDESLEIIDDFGEEEEEEEEEEELPESIRGIRDDDQYNQWWRDHILVFHEKLKGAEPSELYKKICLNIGQSYLKEAEEPANIYTTLKYDDTVDEPSINGLDVDTSKAIGIELFNKAIPYLRSCWDDEDPETWVVLAESLISVGNLHDIDSKDQTKCYDEAEEILRKANNATNGKYKDILDNLLED